MFIQGVKSKSQSFSKTSTITSLEPANFALFSNQSCTRCVIYHKNKFEGLSELN